MFCIFRAPFDDVCYLPHRLIYFPRFFVPQPCTIFNAAEEKHQVIRKTNSSILTRILTLAWIFKFLHNHFEHFSLYKLHSYNSFFVFYENIFFCLFSNIFCYSYYKIIINLLNLRCSV